MHLHRILTGAAAALALAGCGGSSGASAPPQWEACRTSAAAKARVQADMSQGDAFAVPGTPFLVVNGTGYFGLPPTNQEPRDLPTIVADAIAAARADASAKGLAQADYYQQAIVQGGTVDLPIPVGDAPVRGPADAWVTIVEFGDFECPFCRNAEPTLEDVLAKNPADVRLAYKEFPLTDLHEHAMPAALAAVCAGEQGKFWEMHDLLIKVGASLDDGALVGDARQLGLQ